MAKATVCIPREAVQDLIRRLDTAKELDTMDLDTRVNIWKITDEQVDQVLESRNLAAVAENVTSKPIRGKIKGNLKYTKFKSQADAFIQKLRPKEGKAGNLRDNAIALETIFETIKGHSDIARSEGIETGPLSFNNGTINVPLHSMAAAIGRKILHRHGYTANTNKGELAAVEVEAIVYSAGMRAIKVLADNGLIDLHDGKIKAIDRSLEDINDSVSFNPKDMVRTDNPAISLNLAALHLDPTSKKESDQKALKYFTNRSSSDISKHPLSAINQVLDVVNALSQPAYIRFPTKTKASGKHDMDVYELDKTAQAGRESIGSRPLFIDEDLHTFFGMLSKATKSSGKSATVKVRELLAGNPHLMQSLFKIDTNNEVVSQRSNVKGRNQSNAVPLDDLVEYFEYFGTADQELFFDMFMGRNGRGYLDTSVLNYHQSKAMRHALTVKPYTMKTGSDVHKYYINKVAVRLGVSPEHVLGTSANDQQLSDLNLALQALDRFQAAEDLVDKMKAMTFMRKVNPGLDFADLVTTLKAVRGVRDAIGKTELTTNYAVSSDATASGGLITLLQALGTVPAVETLLKSMGILSKEIKQIPDVYELLKQRLEFYVNDEVDPDGMDLPQSKGSPGQTKKVTQLVHEVLNKKDTRKMSKGPTMTFIYGQSEGGAARTLAKEFTEDTLALLKARDPKSLDVINAVMETAYTTSDIDILLKDDKLATDLIGGFVQSGSPGLMYNMLKITVMEKYLSVYKEREKRVFNLLEQYPKMNKLKSFPASAAVEFGKPESKEQLEKYGVPLQKEYEVRHTDFGIPLITRENKLRETVIGVSQVHTADTAAMFRSLAGLPERFDSGVMTVHDDARGSAEMIMEFDKEYKKNTLEVAMQYDIHEQVLLAAALYDPKIKEDPDYDALMSEITEQNQAKQAALQKFNHDTDSIIGDELKDFDIPGEPVPQADRTTPGTATETEATAEVEGERPRDTEATTTRTAVERLQDIAGKSDIISQFLESSNQAKVEVKGDTAKFETETDTIVLPEGMSQKEAVEIAEHEIVHSYTAAVVQNYYQNGGIKGLDGFERQSDLDIAFIEKALQKLQQWNGKQFRNVKPEIAYRIGHIASQDTPTAVAELISVLSTEPDTAAEIYKILDQKGVLKKIVERLVARVREVLRTVTAEDLKSSDVDINLLYSAVNGALNAGMNMREAEYQRVLDLQKGFGDLYHTNPNKDTNPRFEAHRYQDAINSVIARRLNDPAIAGGARLIRRTSELLGEYFPAYKTAMDKISGVYESSADLQQLMHTVTNANIDKKKKNELLSAAAKIGTAKTEITSVELVKFGKETSKLNKAQKKAFYDFTHRMPLHDYFLTAEGVTDIDQGIEDAAIRLQPGQIDALNDIVNMRVREKFAHGVKYSINQVVDPESDAGIAARKYLVLKSIKEIGIDEWNDFKANEGLFQLTMDAVLANASLNANQDNRKLSDMLIKEEPRNPAMVLAVRAEDMHRYSYESKGGWKVLQPPKGKTPGIVYKHVIDQTYNEGAFTDAMYHSSDVDVGQGFRNMEHVVQTADGFKLILTAEQKAEIEGGPVNDAEQGLVRSLTHAMALQDSQNLRDRLLQNDTWMTLNGKKDMKRLETAIKDPNTDHPWFLGGKLEYHELSDEIKAKYMPTNKKLSDVDGFNDKIEYVRKDIAQWLTGDREPSIFNDPKLQWAIRITKHLVAGAKIGMVILNPVKIMNDNISNLAYLAIRGVDPLFIQKQYRDISKEFHDYQQMKNKLNHLRVKGYAAKQGSGVKQQVERLEKQLKEHPANGMVERGFINSLGSNLVMRASDPSSGMKSDVDKALQFIFNSKDGDMNKLGQTIMKLANWNVGIEEFLEMVAKVPGSVDSTKNAEMELKRTAQRLRDVKTQDDVVSYMHQYLNSPDSEFVKMGTYMTDLTDVLSKETLYRYLIARGMDPKAAEIEVIDSFPDYKENLPTRVKQLSDVGIIMFPSYWLRIQKAIYRLIKDKPVNFGTEMSIEAALGIDAPQIWDANIINKATGNYGLTHTPWEHMGWNSLFPTNVL